LLGLFVLLVGWCFVVPRQRKCKSEITFHSLLRDDPKRRCPDTNKLEKLVQWKPTVSFEEGLKKTITWFKQMA
jgi:nucleoside-diphosphate-sugar epimerase